MVSPYLSNLANAILRDSDRTGADFRGALMDGGDTRGAKDLELD